jgi:hypothetical protein
MSPFDELMSEADFDLITEFSVQVGYSQDITTLSGVPMCIYAGARPEDADPGVSIRGFCRRADLSPIVPANGDRVTVSSASYLVEDVASTAGNAVVLRLRQETD